MSNKNTKNIEVEHRATFSKKKYDSLLQFLTLNAKDLGVDDKKVWFFVLPEKMLKVTHNISSKSGTVSMKLTRMGKGTAFKEIEYQISEDSVMSAVSVFVNLGYSHIFEPKILRHNFVYKGVELALKYSKTWGYHVELEIMVASLKEKAKADVKILEVARELRVTIMTEEDLWDFTENIVKTKSKASK